MPLLKDRDRAMLRDTFNEMSAPVRISFFQQAFDCETCDIVGQILDEVVPLGEKIQLVKHNFAVDRDTVAQYGIERIPAMAITRLETQESEETPAERDYGIRFYGVPSGYEFTTLIGAIMDVSSGDSQLSEASRAMLAEIQEPTHIQVFTTPTWPHCPTAVRLSHRMAIENPNVRADMVEVSEFPDLIERYQVQGVPLTVANESIRFEGGAPEPYFIPAILEKLGIISISDESDAWVMDPLNKILSEAETIAVVGLSNHKDRPAYDVAGYLQKNGYRIIPINPNETEVLGEKAYPDLMAVPERIDIVDIFRRPEFVPEIVRQAIARNARVVWMQPGAENYDAAEQAEAAGLIAIVGMCLRVQHKHAKN